MAREQGERGVLLPAHHKADSHQLNLLEAQKFLPYT